MKRILIFTLFLLAVFTAFSQPKKRGRVKRKYRDVEVIREQSPPVFFIGYVHDAAGVPIVGASVEAAGLKRLVHSNESGLFMLSGLPADLVSLRISCIGFNTKTIDYMMKVGNNEHFLVLERGPVSLETQISTLQKREQQISDIPASVSVVTGDFAGHSGIIDFQELAVYEPGLFFESFGGGNHTFSLNRSGGNPGFPAAAPSTALFYDDAPVSGYGGFSAELFDMERTEIIKGPQNVLFGRDALNGAVQFFSKKPGKDFGGYITAGGGNYQNKEARAAINLPVVEDMLFVRAAGIYRDRNGYVKNTEGGRLNCKNIMAGRFSVQFVPAWNHKIDLQFNYQKANEPGTAFVNQWMADDGETGIFSYRASLNRGKELGTETETMNALLKYRLFRNEHSYLTSVTFYGKTNSASVFDAGGTIYPAIDIDSKSDNNLFFQELRYNFLRFSQTNGSIGLNYIRDKRDLSWLQVSNSSFIEEITSKSGKPVFPVPIQPERNENDDLIPGSFLSENIVNNRKTESAQVFLHYTYQWWRKLFFTLGTRAVYDRMQLVGDSDFAAGGTAPSGMKELTKNSLSFTGEAGLTYRQNENFNFYMNVSRGRKPQFLQFTAAGRPVIAGAEILYSGEAGWKIIIKKRLFWDVNGFFRRHLNVHAMQYDDELLLSANGKAVSFGAETGLKAAILGNLHLFGKYAWMQSAFDSTGVDGSAYKYGGNSFAFAPEHSFSAGFTGRLNVARTMQLFATPWYSWKSHFWFTEANESGYEQPEYGILNINFGVEMSDPALVIDIYGTNLMGENYYLGTGHRGTTLGMYTFIPGPPRMAGVRLTWKF